MTKQLFGQRYLFGSIKKPSTKQIGVTIVIAIVVAFIIWYYKSSFGATTPDILYVQIENKTGKDLYNFTDEISLKYNKINNTFFP